MTERGGRPIPSELFSFICEAIDTYSPTYHEDPAVSLFERTAEAFGLSVRRDYVDSTRYNLVLSASPRAPQLVLVGHLDTIAASDTHQPRAAVEGEALYGLGAVDMKAACALMLYALMLEAAGEPATEVHLVVGEEEYGDGALVSAAQLTGSQSSTQRRRPSRRPPGEGPLVVVGEPSSLQACTEHMSYYEAHLTARGNRAHAALPELGGNAVVAMVEWLSAIYTAIGGRNDMVCTPRMIEGGSEDFLVPQVCRAQVDIHSHPSVPVNEIEGILSPGASSPHNGDGTVERTFRRAFYSEGYMLHADDPRLSPLRSALEACGRVWKPGVFRSHSDAPVYQAHGLATVICGPGHLETAHTVDEHIELADLSAALDIYRALIRTTHRGYRL